MSVILYFRIDDLCAMSKVVNAPKEIEGAEV